MKASEMNAIKKMYKELGLDPSRIKNDEQMNILIITALGKTTLVIEYDDGITYGRIVIGR